LKEDQTDMRGNPGARMVTVQVNMAKILLVEDNEMNRDMLSRRLDGGDTR
jgi:hypothetical protein